MLSYIEELRKRPVHERRRVHLVATTIITLVIAIVWVTTLFDTGSRDVIVDHREVSPLGQMADSAASVFGAAKELVVDLGDSVVELRDELY